MSSFASTNRPIRPHSKQRALRRMTWLGLLALPLLTAAGCGEPNASVIIDNGGNSASMSVVIDGQQARAIAANDYKMFRMPPGEHKFYLTSGGRTLFNGNKVLDTSKSWGHGRTYVFNPRGNQRYAVCKVVYGESFVSDNTVSAMMKLAEHYKGQKIDPILMAYVKMKRLAEPMPPSAWFELPSGVQYILRDPPESVYSRYGSESRRVLTRIPSKDYAQLRRGYMIEDPTEQDLDSLANVTKRVLDSLAQLPPST